MEKKVVMDMPFDVLHEGQALDADALDAEAAKQLSALSESAVELAAELKALEGATSLSGKLFPNAEVFSGEIVPTIAEQYLNPDEQHRATRGHMHLESNSIRR